MAAASSCKEVNLFPALFCWLLLPKSNIFFRFLAANRGGLCDGGGKVPFILPIKYSIKPTIFACLKWWSELCLLASYPLVKSGAHITHTYNGLLNFLSKEIGLLPLKVMFK